MSMPPMNYLLVNPQRGSTRSMDPVCVYCNRPVTLEGRTPTEEAGIVHVLGPDGAHLSPAHPSCHRRWKPTAEPDAPVNITTIRQAVFPIDTVSRILFQAAGVQPQDGKRAFVTTQVIDGIVSLTLRWEE